MTSNFHNCSTKQTHLTFLYNFSSWNPTLFIFIFKLVLEQNIDKKSLYVECENRGNQRTISSYHGHVLLVEYVSMKVVIEMKLGLSNFATALVIFSSLNAVLGIRFVIDRQDCFSHYVQYEGDKVHASFVVIKIDTSWQYTNDGVDLEVRGPSGEPIRDFVDMTSEIFEFVARSSGAYRFCFTNRSPYHETIDFDIHADHVDFSEQHAKDEHLTPLLEQIVKLEHALFNIQYEQHWLEAQTERQAIVSSAMSTRTIHKALLESAALMGASFLQVYLLRRLFERKLTVLGRRVRTGKEQIVVMNSTTCEIEKLNGGDEIKGIK
ncbi:hypothetical protein VNO80_30114 [Phaseolus coccineus]|uniref:GOLD domain-containing protein n=1 Tax=Phaseolus coccineus TaxID=3886 RepID=A0AAN9LCN1_PHACN